MNNKHNLYILIPLVLSLVALSACSGESTGDPEGLNDAVEELASTTQPTESQFEMAEIQNDEGGPIIITGELAYTNPFFTAGVAEPLIILEDQAGFIDRDSGYLLPPESQILGQITSDFFTSPFSYNIGLPIEPQGGWRDVDNDDETDEGVLVFAPAYWTNTFGDPFLEKRDLRGGGWSSAYASTSLSEDAATQFEYIGGMILVYSPDNQQGFPAGFGDDAMLFTNDDPIVGIPKGYTLVDLDNEPFTFDRSQQVVVDLLEPESAALDNFSDLNYLEAFEAMLALMRAEYAFTELKGIDWDALEEEYRPRFDEAETNNDSLAYLLALRDFLWSIPDGQIGFSFIEAYENQWALDTDGGLGMGIRETDDGRVIVNFLTPGGPAELAGILLGAEVSIINEQAIQELVPAVIPWSLPFSTDHAQRLQQLRYAVRFPLGVDVAVTYQNPGGSAQRVTLTTVDERESFNFSSFNAQLSGTELPVEYEILDSGLGYVTIYSFSDNELLSIQLWERMIRTMRLNGVPGLIIDIRTNGGGSDFLADQMAAYFFADEIELGNTSFWNESLGDFYSDPNKPDIFYPPEEDLQYAGAVAVLIGPTCTSSCEFFAYDMTIQDRAIIVGQYPSGGLGGSIKDFNMPDGITVSFSIGRPLDINGNIIIEGTGVIPDIVVPVNEETLFSNGDPILEAAIDALSLP